MILLNKLRLNGKGRIYRGYRKTGTPHYWWSCSTPGDYSLNFKCLRPVFYTSIRNYLIIIYIILISGFLLVSCNQTNSNLVPTPTQISTPDPTETATEKPSPTPTESVLQGTVTIWHTWDDDELSILLQIIDDFNNLYPEVHFDVLYIPFDDLLERYELSSTQYRAPAILIGPDWWGPRLYDAGTIADLSNLVDESWLDTFNPASLGLVRYHQSLIGLPYSIRGVVIYRNQSIIPTPVEDFEELVTIAQNATTGDKIGAVLERSFFYSGAHLFGLGGNLMDENKQPAFNDDKGLAWLQLLDTFEEAGPTEFNSDYDVELFKENRVGFLIEGTWRRESLLEAVGSENLAIDPWPSHKDGQLSGFVQSRNLYLNPRILNESSGAVWKFCKFFLSAEYQLQWADLGHIPALLELEVEDPLISQAMTALAGGTPYPTIPEMYIYATNMDNLLMSVFLGGVSPELALNEASERIQETLSETID